MDSLSDRSRLQICKVTAGTVCRALDSEARLEVTCEALYLRSGRLNSLNRRIDHTALGKSRCHKIVAVTVYKDTEVEAHGTRLRAIIHAKEA
jgi:hypothetical protein